MALIVVTGPPAAGKTTYVAEHAQPGDIRIDLDHIANTLAGKSVDNHEHAPHIFAVAKAARQAAIDAAIKQDCDVWLIHTKPTPKQLDDYRDLGATIRVVDPGKGVVMKRCREQRPRGSLFAAAKWYDQHQAPGLTVHSYAIGKTRPSAGLHLDARTLPNPHSEPSLRMLNGTNTRVKGWLSSKDEVQAFITDAIHRIDTTKPTHVWVGCSAGKHRSVYIAEQIADHYNATVEHHELTAGSGGKPKSTHERGYGARHQRQRAYLMRKHKDGAPCSWCGQPMFKNPKLNFDGAPLEAEHSEPQKYAQDRQANLADRLLHRRCNRSKGARTTKPEPPSRPVDASGGFEWGNVSVES